MKYVCDKCFKLKKENEVVKMPWENEHYCMECYKIWEGEREE